MALQPQLSLSQLCGLQIPLESGGPAVLGLWRAGGDLAEVTEEEPRSGGHHLSGCSEDVWHMLVSV